MEEDSKISILAWSYFINSLSVCVHLCMCVCNLLLPENYVAPAGLLFQFIFIYVYESVSVSMCVCECRYLWSSEDSV